MLKLKHLPSSISFVAQLAAAAAAVAITAALLLLLCFFRSFFVILRACLYTSACIHLSWVFGAHIHREA